MKITIRQLLAVLSFITLFASCSKPVAYFQPTARKHFTASPARAKVVNATVAPPIEATVAVTPAQPLAQATTTLDQVDALVRNDSKLTADKAVQKRLNKVRTLLAKTSAESSVAANKSVTAKKMSFMERLMVKKINKKITKQLALKNPEKAMSNKTILVTGAIAVIVGLLVLLLGSSSTLGVIILLAGAVVLVLGLLT